MKPPKKIVVGPHEYRVVIDKDFLMEGTAIGVCNRDNHVIALDTRVTSSAQAESLLHEIVHACLSTVKLEEEVEESVALVVGHALLGVLRDNPKLVAFLA